MCGSEGSKSRLGAALGTNAKSRSTLDGNQQVSSPSERALVDPDTGEILSARLERWALHAVAQKTLVKTKHRIRACCKWTRKRPDGEPPRVDIYRSREHKTCSYGGLQTCGSVWVDPICSAKIAERRRVELKAAVAAHKATGGALLLLTLTHPHTRQDRLADLLRAEQKALHSLFTNRAGRDLWASIGRVGHVRAWEVTHGRRGTGNGWHPHFHILLFVEKPLDALFPWAEQIYQVWRRVCLRAGLSAPSRERGVRLDDGEKAAEYIAKYGFDRDKKSGFSGQWGMDAEMTKGHVKRSAHNETPFDLLRSIFNSSDGDPEAQRLFVEFSEAFNGKRQLVWSRGLRELLALGDELSDEEVSGVQEDGAEFLGAFSVDEWRFVLLHDARGELLEVAQHGWDAVLTFLADLRDLDNKRNSSESYQASSAVRKWKSSKIEHEPLPKARRVVTEDGRLCLDKRGEKRKSSEMNQADAKRKPSEMHQCST